MPQQQLLSGLEKQMLPNMSCWPQLFSSSGLKVCQRVGAMAPNTKGKANPSSPYAGDAFEKGLNIADIHEQWDSKPDVRGRLRDGGGFLHPHSGLCVDNQVCVLNKSILEPIICGMSSSPDRKLPGVGCLRNEIALCFRANKRVGKDVEACLAGDATHVRKLLSFVKAKVRREEVSLASHLNLLTTVSYHRSFLYTFL